MAQSVDEVLARADRLVSQLISAGLGDVIVVQSTAFVGGGSLPHQGLDSRAVSVSVPYHTAEALVTALRAAETPIVGLIRDGRFLMDARTLGDEDLPMIVEAFRSVCVS